MHRLRALCRQQSLLPTGQLVCCRGRDVLTLVVLTVACLLFAPAAVAGVGAKPQPGLGIFRAQGCGGCHTLAAGGGKGTIGPNLDQAKPSRALVIDRVTNGLRGMPSFKGQLSAAQIRQVAEFVSRAAGGAQPPAPAPAPAPSPASAASADRGKNLFTGATQLAKGGPPCLSCHSIAGIGSLGGGAVGPDLTGAYAKYGGNASAVGSILASMPFKTMAPIFQGHPLSAAERADLVAFLARASTERRPGDEAWKLVLLGLAGVAVALVLVRLVWPRHGLSVRRRLVAARRPGRSVR